MLAREGCCVRFFDHPFRCLTFCGRLGVTEREKYAATKRGRQRRRRARWMRRTRAATRGTGITAGARWAEGVRARTRSRGTRGRARGCPQQQQYQLSDISLSLPSKQIALELRQPILASLSVRGMKYAVLVLAAPAKGRGPRRDNQALIVVCVCKVSPVPGMMPPRS